MTTPTYEELQRENTALQERLNVLALRIAQMRCVSEAKQEARRELAEDLAELPPDERDRTIRRIIDQHGDRP